MKHLLWGGLCVVLASPALAQDGSGTPEEAQPHEQAASPADGEAGAEADAEYDPRQMRTEGIENDELARSRFRVGQALYEAGRFMEAAREFEAAFELSERASLLFNAYLAYRDAGNLPEATRALGRYLEQNPEVDDLERLRHRHAAMEETLARQEAQRAEEEAERRRLEEERQRLAQEAETQRRRAEQERRRAQEAEQRRLNPVGIAVGGGGLALVVSSFVTGAIAKGRVNTLEENCPDDRCVATFDLDGERARADRMIRTTDALLFTGLVTTAVGVGLLFLRPGGDDDERAPQVAAGCGPRSCHATMELRF